MNTVMVFTQYSPDREPPSAERNLLLAVLALQNNFISRDALLAGFDRWSANKSRSIAQVLVEQQHLSPQRCELLHALADEHLAAHQGNAQHCLSSLDITETSRRVLGDVADTEVQRSVAGFIDASLEGTLTFGAKLEGTKRGRTSAANVNSGAEAGSGEPRFRILRPHAEGGLGKVSVAHDAELNREVALKEIKPQFAQQDSARTRFLLEAEITGRLEHPGIVPVYGLGVDAGGMPYYAMRFIRGESLKDAIAAFFAKHRQTNAGTTSSLPPAAYQTLEFRGLLTRFNAVCQTIAYAHARGVLHRDIKPANVMLGGYGETLVVDWGLAKTLGVTVQAGEAASAPIEVTSDSVSAETLMGAAMGTVGYMSPEQAGGRVDAFGPATDIYLLGATLYHLLTGHPPHRGRDTKQLLKQIQEVPVISPRRDHVSVPPALAAICLQAMALQPEDRYDSAQEMAADLERYLADEPVQAYREPMAERLRRTLRKRPALTAAFSATLLVGMIGFGIGSLLLGNKNQQLESANLDLKLATSAAQSSQSKAELNAQEAHSRRMQAEQEARKSEKLAEFLTGLFQAADPVGHGVVSVFPKMREESLSVNTLLVRGVERAHADQELAEFPLAKATIFHTIGDVNRQLGRYDDAFPLLQEALDIRRKQLPANSPDLAASCNAMGSYYQERGEYLKAEALFREAAQIRRQLKSNEGKLDLATTLFNIATMLGHEGRLAEAEKIFREVVDIRVAIHGADHLDVAIAKIALAFDLFEQQQNKEAFELVAQSQAAFQSFEGSQALPRAAINFALGTMGRQAIGNQFAEQQIRSALDGLLKGLDKESVWAAILHFELANVLHEQGKLVEAGEQYEASLNICRKQIKLRHPRVRLLVSSYADFLAEQNKREQADALWKEFIAAQEETFGPGHRVVVAARSDFSDYLFWQDRFAEAAAALEGLPDISEVDAALQIQAMVSLGRAYQHLDRHTEAVAVLQAALQIPHAPRGAGPEQSVPKFDVKYWLALARIKQGNIVEGQAMLQELRLAAPALGGEQGQKAVVDVLDQLVKLGEKQADPALIADAGPELLKLWSPSAAPTIANPLGWLGKSLGGASAPAAESSRVTLLRHKVALCYELLGQYDQALPLRKESLAKGEKQFGPEHANTLARRKALERCELLKTQQERITGNLALNRSGKQFPKVSASFTGSTDKVERANDGIVDYAPPPRQRWTAYGSPSTEDWLEVEFEQPTTFSKVELAIYDEGMEGGVQAPSSCTVESWNGDAWIKIPDQRGTPETMPRNDWLTIEFASVTAKRVRVLFVHPTSETVKHAKSGITEIAIWP
jgi:serine/threonine protein kinase